MYLPESIFEIKSINTIFTRDYGGEYFFKGERHDFWEMIYVESGLLTVSEDENVYELVAGQAIFHAPMEFHRFWAKKTTPSTVFKIISFDLETNFNHNLALGVFNLDRMLAMKFEDAYAQIEKSFKINIYISKKEDYNPVNEAFAVKKLETFLLSVISDSMPESKNNMSVTAQRYSDIINFMNKNVCNPLLLEDISDSLHLSPSYIKKLFKLYAGCGVMHYFTRLKVMHSLELLKNGASIKEISNKLGFSSPNYFSAVFKREKGVLPTKYRNN